MGHAGTGDRPGTAPAALWTWLPCVMNRRDSASCEVRGRRSAAGPTRDDAAKLACQEDAVASTGPRCLTEHLAARLRSDQPRGRSLHVLVEPVQMEPAPGRAARNKLPGLRRRLGATFGEAAGHLGTSGQWSAPAEAPCLPSGYSGDDPQQRRLRDLQTVGGQSGLDRRRGQTGTLGDCSFFPRC